MLATGREGQSGRVGCSAMPQGHCAELAFCFSFITLVLKIKSKSKEIMVWDVTINISVTLFVPQSCFLPLVLALFSHSVQPPRIDCPNDVRIWIDASSSQPYESVIPPPNNSQCNLLTSFHCSPDTDWKVDCSIIALDDLSLWIFICAYVLHRVSKHGLLRSQSQCHT